MGVAEPMRDVEGKVGCPTVVDEATPKAGEKTEVGESDPSPFFMDPVPGQFGRGKNMEPGERGVHPDSGLVRMGERGFEDLLFENLRKPVERLVHFDQGVLDGGGAGQSPKEILAIWEERSKGRS